MLGTEQSCRYIANVVTFRGGYKQVSLYIYILKLKSEEIWPLINKWLHCDLLVQNIEEIQNKHTQIITKMFFNIVNVQSHYRYDSMIKTNVLDVKKLKNFLYAQLLSV